jgi:predicted enzyme related to lactoylglutathione lyase
VNIGKRLQLPRRSAVAGGEDAKEKAGISPEFGFYALFTDPCGNIMGLLSGKYTYGLRAPS